MDHLISTNVTKARVARWFAEAESHRVVPEKSWTEKRLAIKFGEHLYLVTNDQIFQCAHCGRYDPQWSATEVLDFFRENFGIKPIEITCSVTLSAQ